MEDIALSVENLDIVYMPYHSMRDRRKKRERKNDSFKSDRGDLFARQRRDKAVWKPYFSDGVRSRL